MYNCVLIKFLIIYFQLNSLSSPLEKAHLHGPAYQGIATTNIPFNMKDLISGDMEGGWNVQGSWRVSEHK